VPVARSSTFAQTLAFVLAGLVLACIHVGLVRYYLGSALLSDIPFTDRVGFMRIPAPHSRDFVVENTYDFPD
jgi:hypothetical protein